MENERQALILIDANGKYDPEKGNHRAMASAMVDEKFYDILINEIQSGKYTEIIYNINLPNCNKKEDIDKAMETDPVLSKINEEYRKKYKFLSMAMTLLKSLMIAQNLLNWKIN